jgi:hypothetical protein
MQETQTRYCGKCERELDDLGNCPKHWPVELARLSEFRHHTVTNRVASKTSTAEDLLTVLGSPLGTTVARLLDALAGLAESVSAGKGKTLEAVKGKPQHAPMPRFEPVWADNVQNRVDNQLWELSENVVAFLNRPTDPKTWAACDTCGHRRLGESTYCQTCGTRILAGAKRCRADGCPNSGYRRSACPQSFLTFSVNGAEVVVPHPSG